jgi:hypothetical protein
MRAAEMVERRRARPPKGREATNTWRDQPEGVEGGELCHCAPPLMSRELPPLLPEGAAPPDEDMEMGEKVEWKCWGIQNRVHRSQNHRIDAAQQERFGRLTAKPPKPINLLLHFTSQLSPGTFRRPKSSRTGRAV